MWLRLRALRAFPARLTVGVAFAESGWVKPFPRATTPAASVLPAPLA